MTPTGFLRSPAALLCLLSFAALPHSQAVRAADFRDWKHVGSVFVLTTPEGADLPESATLQDFPLLVALHRDFFDFRQAQAQGEDLRFSTPDGTALAYQIDEWNAEAGSAQIWVRVPTIRGNTRQEIKIHWGNPAAKSASDAQAVFNDGNGYVSVWHLGESPRDEVGTLTTADTGTTTVGGMIGRARRFPGQKGLFGGDKIPNYPAGASSHSSEAWFRAEKSNATILGWGNEGGGRGSKIRMQLRSPPHVHIDSDFSDVRGEKSIPLQEWVHVVHTYDRDDGKIYINGRLDASAKPTLNIKAPSRLWIGGWYHNYDFIGDIDEVRISRVARSADWIKLQYENQKPNQTLVGPVVRPGNGFSVSPAQVIIPEGRSATFTADAGGAQKLFWILKRNGGESVVAVDRLTFTLDGGRVAGDESAALQVKAVYPDGVKIKDVAITIQERIPEPSITLPNIPAWDGRQAIEIMPTVQNLAALKAEQADQLNFAWTTDGVAVIKQLAPGKIILKRAQGGGDLKVSVAVDNGGRRVVQTLSIRVTEPARDAWVVRTPAADEQPEDHQFIPRDERDEGTIFYQGTIAAAADSVFLRVYADERLFKSESVAMPPQKNYAFAVKIKAGLVKYRTEFGTKTGDRETMVHAATDLICGDAYLIDGQSNADATDVGKEDPTFTSEWIRTYGSMAGDPTNSRLKQWTEAVVRNRQGGKGQIGYWGMELAKQLVENQKIPICIINGAVGGSRIDQHQRNNDLPTDPATIYGRLLWRVQQARLTHGIRGVLWHQGENDQGADGPTGGYGWETYRQYFVDMTAAWKEDYPNIRHYYAFQIWPKACSMGIQGSDNKLREVQRLLPTQFSNLTVMSTLGIKPPGGCHYPAEGYAQFARLIGPVVERNEYGKMFDRPVTAANLLRASFQGDDIALDFDQPIIWSEALTSQFYLDGKSKCIASGSAAGTRLTLKLQTPLRAAKITYLDSAAWNPDNLLMGGNGIAALTFCDVPIEAGR